MTPDLIERLEAAGGPDRELDDAIADAIFTGRHRVCIKGLSDEAGGMWMFRYPDGSTGSSLRFTASIDAALTLVPEGWGTTIDTRKPPAAIVQPDDGRIGKDWSYAATPALALCIAALRAREVSSHD